jgi:hypothetical protein
MTKQPKLNKKLLMEIRDHVLEEPRRLVMWNWRIDSDGPGDTYEDDNAMEVEFPSCNTAACIGGWACILSKVESANLNYAATARELLGLDDVQAGNLFSYAAWPQPFSDQYTEASTPQARALVAANFLEKVIESDGAILYDTARSFPLVLSRCLAAWLNLYIDSASREILRLLEV